MTPEVARATREQMLRDGSCSVRWASGRPIWPSERTVE